MGNCFFQKYHIDNRRKTKKIPKCPIFLVQKVTKFVANTSWFELWMVSLEFFPPFLGEISREQKPFSKFYWAWNLLIEIMT
jgi:hypothetical protein